jgi:hypothetical protein
MKDASHPPHTIRVQRTSTILDYQMYDLYVQDICYIANRLQLTNDRLNTLVEEFGTCDPIGIIVFWKRYLCGNTKRMTSHAYVTDATFGIHVPLFHVYMFSIDSILSGFKLTFILVSLLSQLIAFTIQSLLHPLLSHNIVSTKRCKILHHQHFNYQYFWF